MTRSDTTEYLMAVLWNPDDVYAVLVALHARADELVAHWTDQSKQAAQRHAKYAYNDAATQADERMVYDYDRRSKQCAAARDQLERTLHEAHATRVADAFYRMEDYFEPEPSMTDLQNENVPVDDTDELFNNMTREQLGKLARACGIIDGLLMDELADEIEREREKHGGGDWKAHDDARHAEYWHNQIRAKVWLAREIKDPRRRRSFLLQIAALAMSAIGAFDRNEARRLLLGEQEATDADTT